MSQSFRLGVFIVLTLGILVFGVFIIGRKQSRFESTYPLRAEFKNVAGLNEGADVRVGGIRKGTVRNIELPKRPQGLVTVRMDLETETQSVLKQDSVAEIKSEGLLGNKYLEVSFGSPEAPILQRGDLIQSEPPLDISDLMVKTNQILDTTRDAVENIRGAAGNVNGITAKIDQGKGTAGALINDQTLYQQATAGVTSLREDAEALKHNFLLRGFFKKRGYENASDIRANEIAQVPRVSPRKTFVYDAAQLFDKSDSAKLKNPKRLKDVEQYLQAENGGLVVVASSTDMKGDAGENRELSAARAYVVRQYLVEHLALDDRLIKTVGLGESGDQGGKVQIMVFPSNLALADTKPADQKK